MLGESALTKDEEEVKRYNEDLQKKKEIRVAWEGKLQKCEAEHDKIRSEYYKVRNAYEKLHFFAKLFTKEPEAPFLPLLDHGSYVYPLPLKAYFIECPMCGYRHYFDRRE
jgi:hypothetical protein